MFGARAVVETWVPLAQGPVGRTLRSESAEDALRGVGWTRRGWIHQAWQDPGAESLWAARFVDRSVMVLQDTHGSVIVEVEGWAGASVAVFSSVLDDGTVVRSIWSDGDPTGGARFGAFEHFARRLPPGPAARLVWRGGLRVAPWWSDVSQGVLVDVVVAGTVREAAITHGDRVRTVADGRSVAWLSPADALVARRRARDVQEGSRLLPGGVEGLVRASTGPLVPTVALVALSVPTGLLVALALAEDAPLAGPVLAALKPTLMQTMFARGLRWPFMWALAGVMGLVAALGCAWAYGIEVVVGVLMDRAFAVSTLVAFALAHAITRLGPEHWFVPGTTQPRADMGWSPPGPATTLHDLRGWYAPA